MTAKELKHISEQKIIDLGLDPNLNMPFNYEIAELEFKNPNEIAKRIMILCILIGIQYNRKRSHLKKLLNSNGLDKYISDQEKKLLNKLFLTQQDKSNVSWYSEIIEILGWSIGLWPEIEYFDVCDEDKQVEKIPNPNSNFADFINNAKLIDKERIYAEFDFIYRMHNLAKKRQIGKLGKFTESAYREKHRAISWIVGLGNNWDEISTDT